MAASAQAPLGEIAFSIRDEAGRPVSGAEVIAAGGGWHSAVTDAAGQARLRVVAGTWEVTALHADLVMLPTMQTVRVRAGEAAGIEVRALSRSARINGAVRMRSEPLTLTTLSAAAYATAAADGPLPVAVASLGEDLTFSLAVPPGRWRVGLLEVPRGPGGPEVAVAAGQEARVEPEVDFGTLVGAQGLLFEAGLIIERIGPAFSLTTVGLYAIEGDGRHRLLATTQGRSDQTYAVFAPAPPGARVAAFAWRPGGTPVPAAVRVHALPGSAAFADFRFVVNSGTLVGTAVDAAGRPLPEAWVAAASGVRFEDWMQWGKPVHAPGGVFEVRVPLGPVLLRAWSDPRRMGEPVRVSVTGAAPQTVRLVVP